MNETTPQGAVIAKSQSETIEFYIPEEGLDLNYYLELQLPDDAPGKKVRLRKQAIHRLARYYWAACVLKDMPPGRVLDVACGAGYGSYILATHLPEFEIIGGDYDERAVTHANIRYKNANLRYQAADIVSWKNPLNDSHLGSCDYIASFDTIEHLLFREICLIELAENLSLSGSLLLSTPVHGGGDLLNPGWEHHKIEYSRRTLSNLIRRF